MAKIRVLAFSTAYFPLVGGAEVAVRELTERMPETDVTLICARLRRGLASEETIGRVRVIRVGFGFSFDKYLLPFLGVLKALRLGSFDLVWSIMASYGGFASLIYTWFRPSSRLLLTLQEGDPPERYARRLGVLKFLQRRLFARADAIQTISHFLADWAKRSGAMVEPVVIPNGVDIERFSQRISSEERTKARTEFGYTAYDVVLFSASRLSCKNGIDLLIRSIEKLPQNVKVLLAGDGEERGALEALARELGVTDRVTFLGNQTHERLSSLLQASDVFVRPSRSEGLGNSFLEAMAAGIPVIGTPVGGIPDFLKEGDTGWLAPAEDVEGLARTIERLLQTPKEVREGIVRRAEELVRTEYAWPALSGCMQGLMKKTVSAARLMIATGIYPPEIGGVATAMKRLVDGRHRQGAPVRVVTYGEREGSDPGVTSVPRGRFVFWRYLRFARIIRRSLRPGVEVLATDVFSVGIPTRLALMGRKNRLIIRLGGEWCWEDAVNHGAWVTLKEFWSQPDTFKRKLMRWNYRWILKRAERIEVTSPMLSEILTKYISSELQSKLFFVDYLKRVDALGASLVRQHGSPTSAGTVRFVYVGRFAPVKNVPFLARILRKLYEQGGKFEMYFIGSGQSEPLVKKELEGIPGIAFYGAQPWERAWELAKKAEALLLPSLSDLYPNVVLEAVTFGLEECFITKEHGLGPHPLLHELDPKDEDAWVEALAAFIKRPR